MLKKMLPNLLHFGLLSAYTRRIVSVKQGGFKVFLKTSSTERCCIDAVNLIRHTHFLDIWTPFFATFEKTQNQKYPSRNYYDQWIPRTNTLHFINQIGYNSHNFDEIGTINPPCDRAKTCLTFYIPNYITERVLVKDHELSQCFKQQWVACLFFYI